MLRGSITATFQIIRVGNSTQGQSKLTGRLEGSRHLIHTDKISSHYSIILVPDRLRSHACRTPRCHFVHDTYLSASNLDLEIRYRFYCLPALMLRVFPVKGRIIGQEQSLSRLFFCDYWASSPASAKRKRGFGKAKMRSYDEVIG